MNRNQELQILKAIKLFYTILDKVDEEHKATHEIGMKFNNVIEYLAHTNWLKVAKQLKFNPETIEFMEAIINGKNVEKYGLIEGIDFTVRDFDEMDEI